MGRINKIIIPMGPSKRVDKVRTAKAYKIGGKGAHYLISGGDESRFFHMPEYLNEREVPNENIFENKDAGSYAHIFGDSLGGIKDARIIGVSTNFIGAQRFKVYLESAKKEGLLPKNMEIIGLNSLEWIINPLILGVEFRGLMKDKYFFEEGFNKGLEDKSKIPRKSILGWDIRKIGG